MCCLRVFLLYRFQDRTCLNELCKTAGLTKYHAEATGRYTDAELAKDAVALLRKQEYRYMNKFHRKACSLFAHMLKKKGITGSAHLRTTLDACVRDFILYGRTADLPVDDFYMP